MKANPLTHLKKNLFATFLFFQRLIQLRNLKKKLKFFIIVN